MKKIALLMSVIMVLITFTGCAGTQQTAPAGNTDSAKSSESVRDSVTVATNMVISTIHPFDMTSLQNNQVRVQMYESFYYYNDKTKEMEPRVAESYKVSDDGKVYTFQLRKGIKFHNGEELKASDAVYSVNCALGAPSLVSFVSSIDSAAVVDDYTMTITLKNASSAFMMNLTNVMIASEKACTEAGAALGSSAVMCGTGPYYVTDYKPNVAIQLAAFPDYYRGEAAIKKVTIKPITDSSTGLIAFENGELDFYTIPTSNWKEIVESGKYNTELVPMNHITYLNINFTDKLADKNLRLAVAHCIDKEAMNQAAYDGLAKVAVGMLNSDYVMGAPNDPIQYEYDLEKAKKYLAAAGYPDGVDIGSITTIAGTYFEKIALVLQGSLAQVGIKVSIDSMEQAAALKQMATGDSDILTSGYTCQFDYDFWKVMTHTKADATMFVKLGRANNLNADKIDALYDQASQELDQKVRNDLYKQIDNLLMDTVCFLPVFHKTSPYAWNKELSIVTHSQYYLIYDWSWSK